MRPGISKSLIERIIGGAPKYTIAQLEEKFPLRNLPDGAMVTRFAPSPTGFMHIGGLYQALLDWKLAQQSGGIFVLRIEDTDTKREVKSATDIIINSLKEFNIIPTEGAGNGGNYGSYFQSERKDIYHSVVAELLATGAAYPCFLTATDMDKIRDTQKSAGFSTGIYGEWARDRNLSESEIQMHLDAGEIPSIRLYSTGDRTQKIFCKDAVRGSIAFPQNDEDIVLIKSGDGLPTYHFAHLIDDHFMRTTNVVRGEEWLPSLPLHFGLFAMMKWTPPAYIHTGTIDKIDSETGKQRKLSKRHDPEANVEFFLKDGWPIESVKDYLFNIMASGYEEEKSKNPTTTIENYELRVKKIPTSGALFDWKKLEWWGREFIATLSVDELTARVISWADEYDSLWAARIKGHEDYLRAQLAIERDNPARIRKDFITWKQTLESVAFFWDDLFQSTAHSAQNTDKSLLRKFLETYDYSDDKDTWWNKIKSVAESADVKPGDVAMTLRIALTGRSNTPDLYSIIQVFGDARVRARLDI